MRKSSRLRVHAGRVVTALSSIIEVIDDMEMVDENVFLLGDSHHKKAVTTEDFQVRERARSCFCYRKSQCLSRLGIRVG